AQGTDRDDACGRPADHPLGRSPDLQHAPGLGVDGHHAGLADDDAPSADMDQGIRGPEVDPDVTREPAEEGVEHQRVGTPWESEGRAGSARSKVASPPDRPEYTRAPPRPD